MFPDNTKIFLKFTSKDSLISIWLIFYRQFYFRDRRFPDVTQDLSCPTSVSWNSTLSDV